MPVHIAHSWLYIFCILFTFSAIHSRTLARLSTMIWSQSDHRIIYISPFVGCDSTYMDGDSCHYSGAMMNAMASQITDVSIVYWNFIQPQIKGNIKAPRHWPLCAGNSSMTGEFPAQKANIAETFPFHDVIMLSFFYYRRTHKHHWD